ncbi:hypothetical protein ES708_28445 [subsurface metagenome]
MGDENLDGFILRNEEFISIDDAERMYEQARIWFKIPQEITAMMFELACECAAKRKYAGAQAYFQIALDTSVDDDTKACCLLSIGQLKEQQGDYGAALDWYRKAFDLQPGADETWYFLHNNLGYCLNHVNRYKEAMVYCRSAISIDPDRHNAHKNLDVALDGLGRFNEAAQSHLAAAELCPVDPRALGLLVDLLDGHPEIGANDPDLLQRIESVRRAVVNFLN